LPLFANLFNTFKYCNKRNANSWLSLCSLISFVYLTAAILKNEIGWLDDTRNTSSMLSSRLETDATLLKTIVVDRSTILLQNVGLVVTVKNFWFWVPFVLPYFSQCMKYLLIADDYF